MMMHELSSKITPYYRLLLPAFIYFCVALVMSEFISWPSMLDPKVLFSAEGAITAGIIFLVIQNSRSILQLKRVYLKSNERTEVTPETASTITPDTLHIAGWWKAIDVPLTDIHSVNEPAAYFKKRKNPYAFGATIEVSFKTPTAFGTTISFLAPAASVETPPGAPSAVSHPIITELTLAIHNAQVPGATDIG